MLFRTHTLNGGNIDPILLNEIQTVISNIDINQFRTKRSQEKTKFEMMLFNPKEINNYLKHSLNRNGWQRHRISCSYDNNAFREMDYVKGRVGIEIQFGKYPFMSYDILKMQIFKKHDIIDCGIEVVPTKKLGTYMSSGIGYFEQFIWDLEHNAFDIPFMIIGLDLDESCLVENENQQSLVEIEEELSRNDQS